MTTAQNPAGPWTPLHLVKAVKGWIDPCPFWDEDGQAYLVHAFAGSRCGIKHKLNMCRMKPDGTALLGEGSIVFDGTADHPTMEGPKLYKRCAIITFLRRPEACELAGKPYCGRAAFLVLLKTRLSYIRVIPM